jgi:septal ring factor EnvC (AmiA/AmiB activator)
MGILKHHARDKDQLLEFAEYVQRRLKKAARSLAIFRDYFNYLDRNPPKRMRKEHAQRVVQLHAQDYSGEWEGRITEVTKSIERVEAFVRPLNHYTTSVVKHLKTHTRALEWASNQLTQVTEEIARDQRVLRRYVGFIYRLRRTLWPHS